MKELVPFRAVHPGRIIKRELEARDWTAATLAKRTKLPIQEIDEIIAGDRAITTKIAEALETAFDVPSDFWSNLQALYESDKAAIANARRKRHKDTALRSTTRGKAMRELVPARVIPPGQLLKQEMRARGWTECHLGRISELGESTIRAIISGKERITPERATSLGAAFGTSSALWLNLEKDYQRDKLLITRKKRMASAAGATLKTKRRSEAPAVPVPRTVARRGTRKPKA